MRHRRLSVYVASLGAALLCALLPAVTAPDYVVPRDPPVHVRPSTQSLFRALVIPPVRIGSALGIYGGYGFLVMPAEAAELPSFTRLALEHARLALPFWFLAFVSCAELGIAAHRRLTHRATRSPA